MVSLNAIFMILVAPKTPNQKYLLVKKGQLLICNQTTQHGITIVACLCSTNHPFQKDYFWYRIVILLNSIYEDDITLSLTMNLVAELL